MRRLFAFLGALVLVLSVACVPAAAETTATKVDMLCTVSPEGDCKVILTIVLNLETVNNQMYFPLPANAKDIRLNGNGASTTSSVGATLVDISRITRDYVGPASIQIEYTQPKAVIYNPPLNQDGTVKKEEKNKKEKQLEFRLPLLCGFDYPVQSLSFTVTMPSTNMPNKPTFSSTYRKDSIESDLVFQISGSQIVGGSKTVLNDHEGLTMTMLVPQEMFPSVSTYIREGNPELLPILIFAALAFLYWILFLRTVPLVRSRATTAPEGMAAGELGCRLTLAGGDLTMMVFSWAQLGYILIHLDGNGRVMLHKRMDMGNERSAFENRVFHLLFGSRRVVDGTGNQYAQLCQKVAGMIPNERIMYHGSSGNMKIFRWLGCASQVFCGICVAMNMTKIVALQAVLSLILGVFGAVSAWVIQDVAYRTHLRGKVPVYLGLVCILMWILLGIFCGQIWIPLGCSLGQFLLGYFAAYGGRRSDLGRHDAGQILGLRAYLKHLPRADVGRLLSNDPDYFFNQAPYALALGVIRPFSNAFGRRKLDQCPYLISAVHGKRTAPEWAKLMAATADKMDARARRMSIEKWVAVDISVVRPPKQTRQTKRPRPRQPEDDE